MDEQKNVIQIENEKLLTRMKGVTVNAATPETDADPRNPNVDLAKLHQIICGLMHTLPAPNDEWSINSRVHWLQIAASTFALLYGSSDDSEIIISVAKNGGGDGCQQ